VDSVSLSRRSESCIKELVYRVQGSSEGICSSHLCSGVFPEISYDRSFSLKEAEQYPLSPRSEASYNFWFFSFMVWDSASLFSSPSIMGWLVTLVRTYLHTVGMITYASFAPTSFKSATLSASDIEEVSDLLSAISASAPRALGS